MEAYTEFTIYFWLLYLLLFGPFTFVVCVYLPEIPVYFIKSIIKGQNI
ncbi:uncharacterized protein LOC119640993 [Glossina fuscipes]|uniref:Uncharacterized protein LOC119640993 n=1 Tax=Glossina fuscipes TaxID=7396 RepID=A0A9C5ZB28_9MUSC|nr:uncharacterized protein LOC119640993 [Glossina fuscipes]